MVENDGGETSDFGAEVDRNIARNLKALREARGWSQSELADRVTEIGVRGIYQTTVARIESAQRSLRAGEAIAVTRCLGVTLDALSESKGSAHLRDLTRLLQDQGRAFDDAAIKLVEAQVLVASELDRLYPNTGEDRSVAPDTLRSGVDPNLLAILEAILPFHEPHRRLRESYKRELIHMANPMAPEGRSTHRQTSLHNDMRDWVVASGPDAYIDDTFEDDDGEHPEAS